MTGPHRIRLRGFWETTPLPDGRTRHARPFGRPTLPDPADTVWLVGDAVPGDTDVSLNGTPLGRVPNGQPFAFDVTSLLLPRNRVTLELTGGVPDEVWIEIRS